MTATNHATSPKIRDSMLGKMGYRVIRFWDNTALKSTSLVIEEIYRQAKIDVNSSRKDVATTNPLPEPSPLKGEGDRNMNLLPGAQLKLSIAGTNPLPGPSPLKGEGDRVHPIRAYLDIETSFDGSITMVGMLRPDRGLCQLVGRQVTPDAIMEFLDGVDILHTYNGNGFDLRVIKGNLGLDLRASFRSEDLMHSCHRMGLYGGLKKVEIKLSIPRKSAGLDGMDAMRLWEKYVDVDDTEALDTLLLYNREDVENLVTLRERLASLTPGRLIPE